LWWLLTLAVLEFSLGSTHGSPGRRARRDGLAGEFARSTVLIHIPCAGVCDQSTVAEHHSAGAPGVGTRFGERAAKIVSVFDVDHALAIHRTVKLALVEPMTFFDHGEIEAHRGVQAGGEFARVLLADCQAKRVRG